jgi:hypothetical protein
MEKRNMENPTPLLSPDLEALTLMDISVEGH